MPPISAPSLTHAFDLTVIGPPGFAATASDHSNISVAHGTYSTWVPRRLMIGPTVSNQPRFHLVYRGSLKSADAATYLDMRAGSDWMTLHPDYVDIDARVSCTSPRGAEPQLNVDIHYEGKIGFHGPVMAMFKGELNSTDFGDGYYYTAPILSSRNAELAWVNKTVFLAMGKLRVREEDGDVEVVYRIFKVG